MRPVHRVDTLGMADDRDEDEEGANLHAKDVAVPVARRERVARGGGPRAGVVVDLKSRLSFMQIG